MQQKYENKKKFFLFIISRQIYPSISLFFLTLSAILTFFNISYALISLYISLIIVTLNTYLWYKEFKHKLNNPLQKRVISLLQKLENSFTLKNLTKIILFFLLSFFFRYTIVCFEKGHLESLFLIKDYYLDFYSGICLFIINKITTLLSLSDLNINSLFYKLKDFFKASKSKYISISKWVISMLNSIIKWFFYKEQYSNIVKPYKYSNNIIPDQDPNNGRGRSPYNDSESLTSAAYSSNKNTGEITNENISSQNLQLSRQSPLSMVEVSDYEPTTRDKGKGRMVEISDDETTTKDKGKRKLDDMSDIDTSSPIRRAISSIKRDMWSTFTGYSFPEGRPTRPAPMSPPDRYSFPVLIRTVLPPVRSTLPVLVRSVSPEAGTSGRAILIRSVSPEAGPSGRAVSVVRSSSPLFTREANPNIGLLGTTPYIRVDDINIPITRYGLSIRPEASGKLTFNTVGDNISWYVAAPNTYVSQTINIPDPSLACVRPFHVKILYEGAGLQVDLPNLTGQDLRTTNSRKITLVNAWLTELLDHSLVYQKNKKGGSLLFFLSGDINPYILVHPSCPGIRPILLEPKGKQTLIRIIAYQEAYLRGVEHKRDIMVELCSMFNTAKNINAHMPVGNLPMKVLEKIVALNKYETAPGLDCPVNKYLTIIKNRRMDAEAYIDMVKIDIERNKAAFPQIRYNPGTSGAATRGLRELKQAGIAPK